MNDKRFLIAFVLTLLLFAGYSKLMAPYTQVPAGNATNITNITTVVNGSTVFPAAAPAPITTLLSADISPTAVFQTEKFTITYCATGGYIKNIVLKEYQDHKLGLENLGLVLTEKDKKFTVTTQPDRLTFSDASGRSKEFSFDGYIITCHDTAPGLRDWLMLSNSLDASQIEQQSQEIFYSQDSVMARQPLRRKLNKLLSGVAFAGASDNYYCLALLPGTYEIQGTNDNQHFGLMLPVFPGEVKLYAGPQIETFLEPLGLKVIIHYGFFHPIGALIVKFLRAIHSVVHNWGLTVLLLSIILFALLFPFTAASTQAIKRMQEVQPQMEALKVKYKDNPQKLNQEVVELYRTHKVNPLGGCLPMLLQLPIFISLYQVLIRLIDLKGASFLWIKDLSLPDRLLTLPFPGPLHYLNILPLVIAVLGLVQQKITTSAVSSPEQKHMGLFFAIFMGVIFYNFPACLALYWGTQNLLTLLYQWRISAAKPKA